MKPRLLAIAAATLAINALPVIAGAPDSPPESIRATVEAGGGVSQNETWRLTSVLHQPVAELSTASQADGYSLRSGFLSGLPKTVIVTDAWIIH